jgi:hypothetical protein
MGGIKQTNPIYIKSGKKRNYSYKIFLIVSDFAGGIVCFVGRYGSEERRRGKWN